MHLSSPVMCLDKSLLFVDGRDLHRQRLELDYHTL